MNIDSSAVEPVKTGRSRRTHKSAKLFAVRQDAAPGTGVEEAELLNYIVDARKEWLEASMNFEHAYEEELVDYYTYKMKACEARYTYFIKIAKEKGLRGAIPNHPGALCRTGESDVLS